MDARDGLRETGLEAVAARAPVEAMGRGVEPPSADADDPPGRMAVVYGGAVIGGLLVAISGAILVAVPIGVLGGLVFALIVLVQGLRPPGARRRRRR